MTGAEIKALRGAMGLTQLEFGRSLGLESVDLSVYQTVGRWERGSRRPERYFREKIAKLMAEQNAQGVAP